MDQRTIEAYNQLALEYDQETTDFWDRFPRTFFDTFIERTRGRVLDVGSGPGRDGLILKSASLEVVCLDASEAMIQLSRERGLDSVLGDFTHIPFDDEVFDGVWAYTSLLHIPKKRVGKALSEIRRVLTQGGTFGLGLIEGDTELYRESARMSTPRWFSFYQKDEVESLLAHHGFEVVRFESFKPKSKNYLNFISKKL